MSARSITAVLLQGRNDGGADLIPEEQESRLFQDDLPERIEALREEAGPASKTFAPKRDQIDEAIAALERFLANAGRQRGRKPVWMLAVGTGGATAERRPRAVKAPSKKAKKRNMSGEGKLAIRVGVALRHWKASNPDASEEEIAKQRARLQAELRRAGRVRGAA